MRFCVAQCIQSLCHLQYLFKEIIKLICIWSGLISQLVRTEKSVFVLLHMVLTTRRYSISVCLRKQRKFDSISAQFHIDTYILYMTHTEVDIIWLDSATLFLSAKDCISQKCKVSLLCYESLFLKTNSQLVRVCLCVFLITFTHSVGFCVERQAWIVILAMANYLLGGCVAIVYHFIEVSFAYHYDRTMSHMMISWE